MPIIDYNELKDNIFSFLKTQPVIGSLNGYLKSSTFGSGLNDLLWKAKSTFEISSTNSSCIAEILLSFQELLPDEVIAGEASMDQAYDIPEDVGLSVLAMFHGAFDFFGETISLSLPSGKIMTLVPTFRDNELFSIGCQITGGAVIPVLKSDKIFPYWWCMDETRVLYLDVANAQLENSCLNDALHDLCGVVGSNTNLSVETIAGFKDNINTRYESVRALASQVWNAFQLGGFYGIINVIVSYLRGPSSVEYDDSKDELTFTDNSQYVSSNYLTGIIGNFLGNIPAMVASIVARFSPILTAIATTLGSFLCAIPMALNYDYQTKTRASLIDLPQAFPSMAPHAVLQSKTTLLVDYDQKYQGRKILDVPGGYALVVTSGKKATMEMHPSLADNREALKHFVSYSGPQSGTNGVVSVTIPNSIEDFFTEFNQFVPGEHVIENQADTQCLSSSDDATMVSIIAGNLALLFLSSIIYPANWNQTMYIKGHSVYHEIAFNDQAYRDLDSVITDSNQAAVLRVFSDLVKLAYSVDIAPSDKWNLLAHWCINFNNFGNLSVGSGSGRSFSFRGSIDVSWYLNYLTRYTECTIAPIPGSFNWGLQTPKYSGSSFWGSVAIIVLGTAAVAAITAITAMSVKKAIAIHQAKNLARAEAAWTAACKNPTAENIKTYRSAALKNNIFAAITGGTKLNRNSYWGSTPDTSVVPSTISEYLAGDKANEASIAGNVDIICKLIAGSDWNPIPPEPEKP